MKKKSYHYTNFPKDELNELLHSCKRGDSVAFTKLSAIIREIAFTYFESKYRLGKLNSADDAEDLAQNIYLTFSKQYQNIEKIESWFRRVLFLTFVSFYKNNKKKAHLEFDEEFYNSAEGNDFEQNVDAKKIIEIMNNLDEKKQKIIKLRFWGGLKFSEIAEKTEASEASVKKMFYRTIEELKKKF